jgi:hypothetical protein
LELELESDYFKNQIWNWVLGSIHPCVELESELKLEFLKKTKGKKNRLKGLMGS